MVLYSIRDKEGESIRKTPVAFLRFEPGLQGRLKSI